MNLLELYAKLGLDITDYERGLLEAQGRGKSFGASLTGAFKTVAKVGAAALTAATSAVGAFGAAAVKTGASFDSSMSQVEATMADNAYAMVEYNGQMVQSIDALRDFAQEMGRTTVFSATQSAEALNYMALAGYDAQTSMQMLPTVLDLAAAGNIDLAYASDMVTDAQTALGLTINETTELVDKMARTASRSNTSVEQMGEAILTVGGTAQYMNGTTLTLANGEKVLTDSTTELSMVLGVLADNGIKGSEAGTHLRNALLKLSAPTAEGTAQLRALGVEAFDSEGKLRSFSEIFPELNDAMADLTDEEKLQAFSDIFNVRDIAAANALLGTSRERWAELAYEIENSAGAAEAMADVQLDNLKGDVVLFKSALEGAMIMISDRLTPSLREFVRFGSEGIQKIANAFSEGGLSGAADAFGQVLADGLDVFIDAIPKFIDAGARVLSAIVQGIQKRLPDMAKAAGTMMANLAKYIKKAMPTIIKTAGEVMKAFAEGLAEAIPAMRPIAAIMGFLGDNLNGVLKVLTPLVAGFAALKAANQVTGTIGKLTDAFGALKGGISGVLSGTASLPFAPMVAGAAAAVAAVALLTDYVTNFEANRLREELEPNLEAIRQKTGEVTQAYESWNQSRDSANASTETEMLKIQELKGQLDGLIGANGQVADSDRARAETITQQLLDALGLEYDMNGDLIDQYLQYADSIDTLIRKKEAEMLLEANREAYFAAQANREDAVLALLDAQDNLNSVIRSGQPAIDEYNAAMAELNNLQVGGNADLYASQVETLTNKVNALRDEYDVATQAIAEAELEMRNAGAVLSEYDAQISNYQGLRAGVLTDDQAAMEQYSLMIQHNLKEATTATAAELKAQADEYRGQYLRIKEAYDSGQAGVTESMVESARQLAVATNEAWADSLDFESVDIGGMVEAAVTGGVPIARGAVTNFIGEMATEFGNLDGEVEIQLAHFPNTMENIMKSAEGPTVSATNTLVESTGNAYSVIENELPPHATNAGNSAANALRATGQANYNAGAFIAGEASRGYRDNLQIRSPSKVMRGLGYMTGKAAALGVIDAVPEVVSAVHKLDSVIREGIGVDTANSTTGLSGALREGFTNNITINSPRELDPSETVRLIRNENRDLVLALRMA
ncbi:MAG: phage tail tape measure protein [Lachnospiraceae bacterium]|nr:phage tail tape measure protein [Lachnospiraceae bacterium]